MPFSRSQNSKTAKKSAFICFFQFVPLRGNKKVGRSSSSDFGALANQPICTVLVVSLRVRQKQSSPFTSRSYECEEGSNRESLCNSFGPIPISFHDKATGAYSV